MRRLAMVFVCLSVAMFISTAGGAEKADIKKGATVEGISEYQLDNGLRLLLYPDNSRAKVTVNMTVLVGSRHEGYGETGMAHLLEHMVFKGTPTFLRVPKALQEHGAQWNGTTSSDRTNYFETMPATDENLEFGIRMEADRLVNSFVKKEDLDSEMTVVRNEFERSENSPAGVLGKRIEAIAYDFHNYGKPTIGNRTDIERVPIENLRAFYRKFYQPDNVVLVVAGQFDEKRALELVQKYFGAIPRPARQLDVTWTQEPEQDGERTVTLRRVGDVGVVGVAYHVPAGPHEDSAAMQVLANILSTSPSGRLYKALVETKKATDVFASARGEHDPGLMMIEAEVRDPKMLEEVREIIIGTVEGVAARGVSDEEVNRARQQILKARQRSEMDTSSMAIALSNWASQGDWRLYFLHRDRIEKVTASAIQVAAAKYLQRNSRTVGVFIPTDKSERIAIPTTPDVKGLVENYKGREAMAAGESFEATPGNIEARVQRMELPEGIKAALLPKKTRGQEVQVLLTLRYGNEENLKGFEAAAGILPQLMLRGTKKLSYQQLRDELDRLNATISAGGGGRGRGRGGSGGGGSLGALTFSVETRRENLPAVLEILRQVLREPTLPEDQFEILRRERLAAAEQAKTEPSTLANRLLARELAPYGKDNVRYVPTVEESIARLTAVSYEQVGQLYRDHLGSQAGELTIVGDFEVGSCLPILKSALEGWKAPKPYARIAMSIPDGLVGSQQRINTPDKANADYVSGALFALRDDEPDYPAVVMGNYIFGSGALSSRLGMRVRQKEGLSYGVGSTIGVSPFDRRGSITMTAICNPQNIRKVDKAIREELERLLRDGITQDELDKARQGYLSAQKVRRATDGALASLLSDLSYCGRTMKYQEELEKRIEGLTAEQVTAAARKYFDPKKIVVVMAGDFGKETSGQELIRPNGN
ncbi:MAG TPA: pitrilysin family protein [Tepidisphaeraceae bacterium]|nr:pitrilysin family protein [Tepidisphaeraceae bacterium]